MDNRQEGFREWLREKCRGFAGGGRGTIPGGGFRTYRYYRNETELTSQIEKLNNNCYVVVDEEHGKGGQATYRAGIVVGVEFDVGQVGSEESSQSTC